MLVLMFADHAVAQFDKTFNTFILKCTDSIARYELHITV